MCFKYIKIKIKKSILSDANGLYCMLGIYEPVIFNNLLLSLNKFN